MYEQEPEKVYINETHYTYRYGSVKLHRELYSYAKPEINSIIVKNFLALISWCGILWLFTRIRKFILSGLNY